MRKVVLDVSMSLDGFTAGPNVREDEPMGDGGERRHAWMAGNGTDSEIAPNAATSLGVPVCPASVEGGRARASAGPTTPILSVDSVESDVRTVRGGRSIPFKTAPPPSA